MTSNLDNLLSVAASSLYIKILNKLWVRLDQVQYYHYPPLPPTPPTELEEQKYGTGKY